MLEVVLVDQADRPIGTMEKLEAHEKGLLHRAFSVFVFNDQGEMLLQQRALSKYHSSGLWSNTCCSHPTPNESLKEAGEKRLQEEMGFSTPLSPLFAFEYRVDLDNNLTEHEFDHVFIGQYNGEINPNPTEVMDHKWVSMEQLKEQMTQDPNRFTAWFQIILTEHSHHFQNQNTSK